MSLRKELEARRGQHYYDSRMSIRVTGKHREFLETQVERTGATISEVIRVALDRLMDSEGGGK